LRYHAQLFKEDIKDPAEHEKFWLRELLRLEKFRNENQEFYEYYKKGYTDKDELYFMRANADLRNVLKAGAYDDINIAVATSHDWMVARIQALEKYSEYVRAELN
jgi:hypothetical protein